MDATCVLLSVLFSVCFQRVSVCIFEHAHEGGLEPCVLALGLVCAYVVGSCLVLCSVKAVALLASVALCHAISESEALLALLGIVGYASWLSRPTRDSFHRRSIRELFDIAKNYSQCCVPSGRQYAERVLQHTPRGPLGNFVRRAVVLPTRMAIHAMFMQCIFQAPTTSSRQTSCFLATGSLSSALKGMSTFSSNGRESILDTADRLDMIADVAFHNLIFGIVAVVNVSGQSQEPDKVYSLGIGGQWVNLSAAMMEFSYLQLLGTEAKDVSNTAGN
jgi:hypothetical protein